MAEKEGGDGSVCELFGVSSKDSDCISGYIKKFYSHSNEHPDGWGLAILDGNEAMIEKEPVQASKSQYLKERLSQPICAKNVFAHIRYATIGNVEYRNCHPYTRKDNNGRRWTLIHNGTIFEYNPLNKFIKIQEGDTDSERILLYLVEQINLNEKALGRTMDAEERFQLLDSIVTELSEGNKLNFLLYDAENIYVHTNYKNSLYYLEQEERVIFSTRPLSEEEWKPVPFTTLLAYHEGRRICIGTNHGNEYFENEENMKMLYQIFSSL